MTTVVIQDSVIQNPKTVRKAFELPDGTYTLELKKKSKRTNQQNRYYWGVV